MLTMMLRCGFGSGDVYVALSKVSQQRGFKLESKSIFLI